jgi:hypothetical protein
VRVIPPEIRSLFSDAEIAEIAGHPVRLADDSELDAIDLAQTWANRVQKIDRDRALPSSDHSVWTEHDLAGTLFARDRLQRGLEQLPPALRERLESWVAGVDERFRSFTVDDPAGRMGTVANVDLGQRSWWWRRVPDSGPITEFLTMYQGSNL